MNTCGILPVLTHALGLPYPDVMYPLDEGMLLLDNAIEQMKFLGISVIYIPCTPKVCEYLTNSIFYERRGVEIRYVQMDVKDPLRFLTFAVKACRRAAYIHGFSRFMVLDATKHMKPTETSQLFEHIELPFFTNIPGLLVLNDDAVTAIRRNIKTLSDEDAICAALGTRKVTLNVCPCDFTDWAQVKAYQHL